MHGGLKRQEASRGVESAHGAIGCGALHGMGNVDAQVLPGKQDGILANISKQGIGKDALMLELSCPESNIPCSNEI